MKVIDLFKVIRNGKELNSFYKVLSSRRQMERDEVTQKVKMILDDIKNHGDKAVIEYTKQFDNIKLGYDNIRVAKKEIDNAYDRVDKNLINVIRKAGNNIRRFHEKQKDSSWFSSEQNGIMLGQLYRPLETVGVYVPGGTAPLVSSILMTVIPAKVAGVGEIIMSTPPGSSDGINPVILAAARELGVDTVCRIGGAQAIGAMAFGTESVRSVDKIIGPGNVYVAEAKRMVYGYCDIDMIAGPSEITIIADENARPDYIAADLLSQAEHDSYASSVLITVSEEIACNVCREAKKQTKKLARKDIIKKSVENFGGIILVESLESALEIANKIAPEHLELCVEHPFDLISEVKNAGAIFLGHYSPEPLGDYFAGPNHVLPTCGTASFFSPLGVEDFMKKSSIVSYTEKALKEVKDDIMQLAETEGLTAHKNAINIRFDGKK